MKKITKIYKGCSICFMILFLILNFNAHAQKNFSQRTSTLAPQPYTGKTIYNLRGDFEMLGNTNLVRNPYNETANNNSTTMQYVDIDGDNSTANSSSAYLNIPNDGCTKVVYAGLYWSGRAQTDNTNAANRYAISQNSISVENYGNNTSQTVTHGTNNSRFNLNINRQGSSNAYYVLYELIIGGKLIQVNYRINGSSATVEYRLGTTGGWTSIVGSYASASGTGTFTITDTQANPNPLKFTVDGRAYNIISLRRNTSLNASEANYQSTTNNNVTINAPSVTTSTINKNFDKRKVKLKKEGGTYREVTANDSDILYPYNEYDYIYAGYADITDYVQQQGAGNYYVADLALKTGNGGGTGYSGGWGMIVIYENPTMKWRDITIFDGHKYVVSGSSSVNEIVLNGFKAAQNGDINVDMGFLAAEGEANLVGDYFRMRRADLTTTTVPTNSNINNTSNMNNPLSSANGTNMLNYPYITNTGTTRSNTNFFNSSIGNGNTQFITLPNNSQVESRTPFYNNNYGFDLAKIKLDNADKKFIKNSQTDTRFYYGTNGDTYVIYNVVFAVDAYVPETEVFSVVTSPTGTAINNLQPNDIVTLTADIHNYGTDAVNNGKLQINIPQGMQLISAVVNTPSNSGANGTVNFGTPTWTNPVAGGVNGIPAATLGGVLDWDLGYIPTQALVGGLKVPLATLTYKLKVTDNCMILQASKDNCILYPEVEGTITGKGALSGSDFSQELSIGYNTDCNNTPIYGGLEMKINPSETFLNACSSSNPIINEVRMFKRFCSATGGVIPRAEVIGVAPYNYPEGTVFYDESGGIITGDFPIDPLGNIIMYRAVLPGSPLSCYLKLATQLDVITQSPSISNIDVCFGTGFTLNPTATGQDPSTSFYYFENGSATQLAAAPQPNKPGVYTYQVALGKVEGVNYCFGPKTTFTITIRNCKTPVNPMIYTPLKR